MRVKRQKHRDRHEWLCSVAAQSCIQRSKQNEGVSCRQRFKELCSIQACCKPDLR